MIELTYDKVVELAKAEIAKEGDDFIYEQKIVDEMTMCLYVHDGCPDCLVGRILHAAGVELEAFEHSEGDSAHEVLENLECDGMLQYTPEVLDFLSVLQSDQDYGRTWGYSLARALGAHKVV